ncbi:MAG: hypothetical protein Q9160_004982 [Pyrenula sp. 1 TL-2023]
MTSSANADAVVSEKSTRRGFDSLHTQPRGSPTMEEAKENNEPTSFTDNTSEAHYVTKAPSILRVKPPVPPRRRATQPSRIPRLGPNGHSATVSYSADKPLPSLPEANVGPKAGSKRRSIADTPRQTRTSILRAQKKTSAQPKKKTHSTSRGSPILMAGHRSHSSSQENGRDESPTTDDEGKATIPSERNGSNALDESTCVELVAVPEDSRIPDETLDRIDSDSVGSERNSIVVPTSPRFCRLPSNDSNSDSTKVDETSISGYRIKNLSSKAPAHGPQLKISEAADDIIMGRGSNAENGDSSQVPLLQSGNKPQRMSTLSDGSAKPQLWSSVRDPYNSVKSARNVQEATQPTSQRTKHSQASARSSLAFPPRTSSLATPSAPKIGATVSKASSGIKELFRKRIRSKRSTCGSPRKNKHGSSSAAPQPVNTERTNTVPRTEARPGTQLFSSKGHAYVARLQDAAGTAPDIESQNFFAGLAGVTSRALECREFARDAHDRAQQEAEAARSSAVAATMAAAEAKTHAKLANDVFFDTAKLADQAVRRRSSGV